MRTKDKLYNIQKANLILETNYLWGEKIKSLSENHIKYVLGIQLPENESYYGNPELIKKIIEEQIIYENWLTQFANYAKEMATVAKDKVNNVISTVKDWADIAAIFLKMLKDGTGKLIDNYLASLEKRVNATILKLNNKIKQFLGDVGKAISKKIDDIIKKVMALSPVKKLFALIAIGSIANFFEQKITTEEIINQILSEIISYFSDNWLTELMSALTGWTPFITFINGLKTVAKMIFDYIGNHITAYGLSIDQMEKTGGRLSLFKESNVILNIST